MARRYQLKSSEIICTPGIVRQARAAMESGDPEQKLWGLKLLMGGFPTIPSGMMLSLLNGDDAVSVTYHDDKETVILSCTDEAEKRIGLPTEKECPGVGGESEPCSQGGCYA